MSTQKQIKIRFPQGCFVDRSRQINEETGQPKKSFWRGIAVSNVELFKEHYLDRDGNPITREDGEPAFYAYVRPQTKRVNGRSLPNVYEDMILEAWTSEDGTKGLKIVTKNDHQMLEEALLQLPEGEREKTRELIRPQIAQDIFASIFQRNTGGVEKSAPISTQETTAPEPKLQPEPGSNNESELVLENESPFGSGDE
jgi:hypothetical protein